MDIEPPSSTWLVKNKNQVSAPVSLGEECGVLAMNTCNYMQIKNALLCIQHRGHTSSGIVGWSNGKYYIERELGLIEQLVDKDEKYEACIGHVRYATSGYDAISPLRGVIAGNDEFYLAHNGHITNIKYDGIDTQYIVKFIEENWRISWEETIKYLLESIKGVYSLVIINRNKIIGTRDRYGVRPLVLGRINKQYVISSESLPVNNYIFDRSIEPGEIISIDNDSCYSIKMMNNPKTSLCLFEYIYFSREYSIIENDKIIEEYRYSIGFQQGKINKLSGEYYVLGIPNTGIMYGRAYSEGASLEYRQWITKINKSRTFILPNNATRSNACKNLLEYDEDNLKDKKVILVDDSLVRGNVIRNIVSKLRECMVKEIHLRVMSPAVISQCYYGVDIPTKEELIAHGKTELEIADILGIDSVKFTSLEEIYTVMKSYNYCSSCFTGEYSDLLDW